MNLLEMHEAPSEINLHPDGTISGSRRCKGFVDAKPVDFSVSIYDGSARGGTRAVRVEWPLVIMYVPSLDELERDLQPGARFGDLQSSLFYSLRQLISDIRSAQKARKGS